ncbi:MAG: DUF58 domain-containing protein [Alkalilacustris sp.]
MNGPAALRHRAEGLAGPLPPLLAEAEHMAATVMLGEHGRRRAGHGDEFWQYRPAHAGDALRLIDWRRSGRSDAHFVREREWQAAQSVALWVDDARSMGFSGARNRAPKSDRARVLALALAVLLVRAGERVGLASVDLPPRSGQVQLMRLAARLCDDGAADYGAPDAVAIPSHARAVFLSDFLGDIAPVEAALTSAADRGVRGALVMVLDPVEEAFPFDGRTIFESMGGGLRHETLKAGDLRGRYLARLAERKDRLTNLARITGWQFTCHHTGDAPLGALMWLYRALDRVRP